jgi:hypothetical protein
MINALCKQAHFSYFQFFFYVFLFLAFMKKCIHFSASSFLPVSYESAKACAVVVENDSSSSSSQISTKNAITKLNSHNSVNPQLRNAQNIDYSRQGSSSPSTYLSQVPGVSGKYKAWLHFKCMVK